jgi:hypothetical protein
MMVEWFRFKIYRRRKLKVKEMSTGTHPSNPFRNGYQRFIEVQDGLRRQFPGLDMRGKK